MRVTVKIPSVLRQVTDGKKEIEVEASTVGEILSALKSSHPGLFERVVDEGGDIRRFVNVFVGNEDIRFTEGLSTKVDGSEDVWILPAVAGG